MFNKNAKWITNGEFCLLEPQNVFHKELDDIKLSHDKAPKNRHILFRKKVDLPEFANAVVRISADDYYKLYINGVYVAQGPAPGYPFHYYYNEIDVSKYLVKGENTIAVHTYYQGLINRVWVSGDYRHGLVFDFEADGKNICVSDESWKCAVHTGFTACGIIGYDTAFAERFDAGSPEYGFELPEFDDSNWENAKIRKVNDVTLYPQPTKLLDCYDVKPEIVRKTPQGYFIDFGFEAVGYLKFSATGKKGDKIIMHFSEELDADAGVRYDMRCNCKYEEEFVLSGREKDTLSQYDYKAFRYVELVVPDGVSVDESSVAFTVRHYPFNLAKKYTGNNKRLNDIFNLCADTIKYGVQECFVDCPTREKGQYLGDVTIAGIASAVLTDDVSMMKKALENYAQSSFICKGIMTVAPASLMQEIADYSMQFPFQVLWLYKKTGDIEFLKQMYPFVLGVYEYFNKYRNDRGLLESVKEKWNLVDWPANLRDDYDFDLSRPVSDGCHNVVNAFYCAMLKDIDEIRKALSIEPLGITDSTVRSYVEAFYDEKQKLFVDSIGSQHASYHSNVMALYAGIIVDEENKRNMVKLISEKRLTCAGVYMAFFTCHALKKIGEQKLMEDLLADDGAWANMLSEGATTCFEAWGKDQKWNTSLFHPWATAPAIFLD